MPPYVILLIAVFVFAVRTVFASGRRSGARRTGTTGAPGATRPQVNPTSRPIPRMPVEWDATPQPVQWRATLPPREGEGADLGHGEGYPNRVLEPAFPDTLPRAEHMLPMDRAKAEEILRPTIVPAIVHAGGISPRDMIIANAILTRRGGRMRR